MVRAGSLENGLIPIRIECIADLSKPGDAMLSKDLEQLRLCGADAGVQALQLVVLRVVQGVLGHGLEREAEVIGDGEQALGEREDGVLLRVVDVAARDHADVLHLGQHAQGAVVQRGQLLLLLLQLLGQVLLRGHGLGRGRGVGRRGRGVGRRGGGRGGGGVGGRHAVRRGRRVGRAVRLALRREETEGLRAGGGEGRARGDEGGAAGGEGAQHRGKDGRAGGRRWVRRGSEVGC